jgi:hypothetical protein
MDTPTSVPIPNNDKMITIAPSTAPNPAGVIGRVVSKDAARAMKIIIGILMSILIALTTKNKLPDSRSHIPIV